MPSMPSRSVAFLAAALVLSGAVVCAGAASPQDELYLIQLRRESVPVHRRGAVVSHKTSYSGKIRVGSPSQVFSVVFDTGSGHVVLPAKECASESCQIHRRYDMSSSKTATPVNVDGSVVLPGELCDQVTIGFGTGTVTGEFAHERVCAGGALQAAAGRKAEPPCGVMRVVMAVEMSEQPFKSFHFDGIFGLGLDSLAMNKNFSAFDMLVGHGKVSASHFGVFLTEGEDDEGSEIAMGGINEKRMLDPLSWAPVAMADLGYWQIHISAVRINGVELDVCKDGTCRGVVDTGTSHLGIPAPFDGEIAELLTREAGDLLDCRNVEAPEIEFDIAGRKLTLHPFNYMRRLPLREGVSVSSSQGVYVPSNETNATLGLPSSADAVNATAVNTTANATSGQNASSEVSVAEQEAPVRRHCRPRLMPVRLPEPLGPKLFILGEPVLHRYYTVFDWGKRQVGFSLANNRRNTMDPAEFKNQRGELPKEVDMLLMQKTMQTKRRLHKALPSGPGGAEEIEEEAVLLQVKVRFSVSRRPRIAI
mmetsp:Transcript_22749/g.58001  ORF Transcript_22749/g.58001 Transcript_22749/m.58001 type:complete len:534 (+) Transcript_22749:201-1802(+)